MSMNNTGVLAFLVITLHHALLLSAADVCVNYREVDVAALIVFLLVDFVADVFVHKIHSSSNWLQSIVTGVRNLMLDPIGKSITQIESTLLIDPEVASSRTWV